MNRAEIIEILHLEQAEQHLQRIELVIAEHVQNAPAGIRQALQRTVGNGGKRLRPLFVLAATQAFSKPVTDSVIRSAAAIELLHIASLIHDDFLDNAATRHGATTIHATEGTDYALLAGDYLIGQALSLAAATHQQVSIRLATAFTDMCAGQVQETENTRNLHREVAEYRDTIRKKTGALFGAACAVGGICAGATKRQIDGMARYGETFGSAFQIIDDVLDIYGDSETLGKLVGTDIQEGVYTLPVLLSMRNNPQGLVKEMLQHSLTSPVDQQELRHVLEQDGSLACTLQEILQLLETTSTSLHNLPAGPITTSLTTFPRNYANAALKKLSPSRTNKA